MDPPVTPVGVTNGSVVELFEVARFTKHVLVVDVEQLTWLVCDCDKAIAETLGSEKNR